MESLQALTRKEIVKDTMRTTRLWLCEQSGGKKERVSTYLIKHGEDTVVMEIKQHHLAIIIVFLWCLPVYIYSPFEIAS